MTKYIYAFGSICRGEIDKFSDVDLLMIVDDLSHAKELHNFSYYQEDTLKRLWKEGNPFAWHLYSESKLIYSYDNIDFIQSLNKPALYKDAKKDITYLFEIFLSAKESLLNNSKSTVYDLSVVFLVIRNIATCFELGVNRKMIFTRNSPLFLTHPKLNISKVVFNVLSTCRIISTRGIGKKPTNDEISESILSLEEIENWINSIQNQIKEYESV